MTASDARPPSDTDDEVCGACSAPLDASGDCSVVGNRRHPRPPSDTEATGGWHTHGENSVWRDGERDCETVAGPSRPVLVVDPAEARETIARALAEGINNPRIDWLYEAEADLLAAAVIAALATETPA